MNIVVHYNYWAFIFLMMVGFYILISRRNLVKKIMGLNIFQTSVFIFFISMGVVKGGQPPILPDDGRQLIFSNPLPHVLILTAIVVGVSTTAVALALVVRIKEAYGTIEGDEVTAMDNELPA